MAETCHGLVMPHELGSNRACLNCEAHGAIKRMQSRPFQTDEQWAEKAADFIVGKPGWDQTEARHLTPAQEQGLPEMSDFGVEFDVVAELKALAATPPNSRQVVLWDCTVAAAAWEAIEALEQDKSERDHFMRLAFVDLGTNKENLEMIAAQHSTPPSAEPLTSTALAHIDARRAAVEDVVSAVQAHGWCQETLERHIRSVLDKAAP